MSHARKTIRSAIATILKNSPSNWQSVTETRIQSTRQVWPYLMVFAESESANQTVMSSPGIYDRDITIAIVGLLRLPGSGDTYTIEDKMDALASEIETKLTAAVLRAAVSRVQTLSLVATKMDVILEDNGVDHAQVHQTWKVTYSTAEGSPDALI